MRRALTILLALWGSVGLAGAAYAVQGWMPTTPQRVAAQVAFLDDAIADGAGARMQALFPEGEFFTVALTALAAGNLALAGDDEAATRTAIERLGTAAATIDAPAAVARFGDIPDLPHGTFQRGWSLLLKATRAELDGVVTPQLLAEATTIAEALAASPTGVVASYPGGYWPCDAVVAMAAVHRVHELAGEPIPHLAPWLERMDRLRDPATGLLPHRIDADGAVRDGPRGSSQAIIHMFWPELSRAAAADWVAFRTQFVAEVGGLVGIREYPTGIDGGGDVDSGPLVFGVSLSASAVALGAARANGDDALARALDHEAEFFGLPWEWAGRRSFAAGTLPTGDAFVAWARSVPPGDTADLAAPVAWGLLVMTLVLAAPLPLAPLCFLALHRRVAARPPSARVGEGMPHMA